MNFIISIGGSGSKCMESLIYLMAAKFLPSTEEGCGRAAVRGAFLAGMYLVF